MSGGSFRWAARWTLTGNAYMALWLGNYLLCCMNGQAARRSKITPAIVFVGTLITGLLLLSLVIRP